MGAPVTKIVRKLMHPKNRAAIEDTVSAMADQRLCLRLARDSDDAISFALTFEEHNKWYAAGFVLREFPGNCGILISTAEFVDQDIQGKGIGQYLHQLRIDIARTTGYTILQCTTVDGNGPQEHILRKNGWEVIYSFKNERTGNTCHQWALKICKE